MIENSCKIAVLIPCYNEEVTVSKVVNDFRQALGSADIYVYDNNSTDATVEKATQAGAIVRSEATQGKGNVVRRMFADIEADIYVLVDGDDTYPASDAVAMIERLRQQQLDMVIGKRCAQDGAYRAKHAGGNVMFNQIVQRLFQRGMSDIFSGYRVFSHRFVKSFPAVSRGFEIETELSVHVLETNIPFTEMDVNYSARPEGSQSKLNTYQDGLRILLMIVKLLQQVKPLKFYSAFSVLLMATALILGYPLIAVWLETGLVPRIPTAIIVMGLLVFSLILFNCGLILEGVSGLRKETKRLRYLRFKAPQ